MAVTDFFRTGILPALAAALLLAAVLPEPADAQEERPESAVLVIHGGVETILPENMTSEREREYRDALTEALEAGHAVLSEGGGSVEAVVAAIQPMEESELFNAGRGAVFTSEGTVEHDAAIMDGRTREAGAVTGVDRIRSPIAAARLVMEESVHVMLSGEGAVAFADRHGLELIDNEHFHTERRREALERAREREREGGGGSSGSGAAVPASGPTRAAASPAGREPAVLGTVGAVALDRDGNLAAATSTGGTTNKRFGRIGDSPIIGAGTYADNETAAISATGHGEFFIRGVVAHDVASMMRYAGLSLTAAANAVIMGTLVELGGTGGVIALDRDGNFATPFNTPGMYRGVIDEDGNVVVEIFR